VSFIDEHRDRFGVEPICRTLGWATSTYYNAMTETFVVTLKRDLVRDRIFATRFEAEIAIFEWLGWFNHRRLHCELGYTPPAEFEAHHHLENSALST
jgi:transposase InsO family protein